MRLAIPIHHHCLCRGNRLQIAMEYCHPAMEDMPPVDLYVTLATEVLKVQWDTLKAPNNCLLFVAFLACFL